MQTTARFPGLERLDLDYAALRTAQGLSRLDAAFRAELTEAAPALASRLDAIRAGERPEGLELSEWLIATSGHLEDFLTRLFSLDDAIGELRAEILAQDPVMRMKAGLVSRRARRYRGQISASREELHAWVAERAAEQAPGDMELGTALLFDRLINDPEAAADLDRLIQWAVVTLKEPVDVADWVSFRLPGRVDHARLVNLQAATGDPYGRLQAEPIHWRPRDGFALTDTRAGLRAVQDQVNYCIFCHDHDGDFCAKGFPEKKGSPELGLKQDPLGNTLTGCPLEEKISEMHALRRDGRPLAALAVAMRDNPMIPATGHRICNDCMKACIYQKQDPVNIPQIETRVLTDILDLPWGVELYDLLTRWNPLRSKQPVMQDYNGRRVLIAGLGPAGFTMAHHLTQEGCAVVGIDGLKIEPLPQALIDAPVEHWSDLVEPLDSRILLGFGGVAEYGITPRWDKNFLKLIYLTLLRRPTFQAFGGVRLGGTLTLDDAWRLGFDHVCLATGAGLPRVIPIGNSLARGMRQASDFLMALQLTGAGKEDSLANLQVRLPAVVIGGGLTAIDTATEVQAYYIKQVEKVLARHEALEAEGGDGDILPGLNPEDQGVLAEFLAHGRAVRAERERAAAEGRAPDFIHLLREWGGVTLAYRKGMNASPAYLRNHEEIIKAAEEGIYYAEGLDPQRVELDDSLHTEAVVFRRVIAQEGRWIGTNEEVRLPARAVFVAAGTVPNTLYEREYPNTFELEGTHYKPHRNHTGSLQPVDVSEHCKSKEFGGFTSYENQGRKVTFLGDTNPVFNGSVVKAIASAKRSYGGVMRALNTLPAHDEEAYDAFAQRLDDRLVATVAEVLRPSPAVVELWVRAPMAARNYRPGQFFRLQTFESTSETVENTRLQIPVITVSGTGVDGDRIRLLVLQWGSSPRLTGRLKPGEPVVLMGPTGAPVHIPEGKTVLIVAGRWGAAVMLDLGPALRAAGNRVVYVGAFSSAHELDRQDELEQAADQIIWAVGSGRQIDARRPQDISIEARDVVELLQRYGAGEFGKRGQSHTPLSAVDQIMVMGSTGLLGAFQQALQPNGRLHPLFKDGVQAHGTVGSPMQCMLKGVCGQCLQWQIDPETGERTRAVFSCAEQDQPLAWIDVGNLAARQAQNRLSDRLTARWLDHVLAQAPD
ncbi:FAD-dependent oxidoreductase [Acidihalobacter ferrooxydans]|uniref:Pyridine nucleotide-disulfide oxidoreductase n=1 Tax=Acidihalobacter ferrooxydans TaxID=1765967 RepID=A0A1P8UF89_9GAMM|nr:FAD-dependent oxidoreductase [Acidihalobacter ferrooxydans]APZ42496.1 pyridine nucleotide-disulfide oxidoreductase [Acidihalobacter ferrooxydans]